MRWRPVIRRGGFRWLMSMLTVIAVTVWLGFAFFWEASAAGSPGRVLLRRGRLSIQYELTPPLPPGLYISALAPWPPPKMWGVRCGQAFEGRLDWSFDTALEVQSAGPVVTSNGPSPTLSVAKAWAWKTVMVPLWPAVLVFGALAFVSWRRHQRRMPGECGGCGYDRRGLAVGGKCPECGTTTTAPTPAPSLPSLPSN